MRLLTAINLCLLYGQLICAPVSNNNYNNNHSFIFFSANSLFFISNNTWSIDLLFKTLLFSTLQLHARPTEMWHVLYNTLGHIYSHFFFFFARNLLTEVAEEIVFHRCLICVLNQLLHTYINTSYVITTFQSGLASPSLMLCLLILYMSGRKI